MPLTGVWFRNMEPTIQFVDCVCQHPAHVVRYRLETDEEGRAELSMAFRVIAHGGLWARIKHAFAHIFRQHPMVSYETCIVHYDDMRRLRNLLDRGIASDDAWAHGMLLQKHNQRIAAALTRPSNNLETSEEG